MTTEAATRIADELSGFGGLLRCDVCGREQPVRSIAGNLQRGGPTCCGQTMRWRTQAQLAAEGEPNA